MNSAMPQILCSVFSAGVEEPQQAVDAGRESLNPWWSSYPWYDSTNDDVEAVDLSRPWWEDWELPDWDWLNSLGNWNFSLPDSPLQWLAWITVGVLLILVVWLLIRAYRGSSARKSQAVAKKQETKDENDAARIESLPFSVAKGRLNLLAEARRYYDNADYAKAVIYLFSFQLVELDKHQHIHLTKGKTNRQYMREVGRRRSLRTLVEQTMVAFEDVFFGNLTLDRRRFESCWSRLDEFQTQVAEKNV
jgi:hypothetical protein